MATPNHTKLQLELLCKEFTEAVEHISNSKTPFEEETQKRLFGLFHIARVTPRVNQWQDAEQKAAVQEFEHLSPTDAMREYINVVTTHDPSFLFEDDDEGPSKQKEQPFENLPPALQERLEKEGIMHAPMHNKNKHVAPPSAGPSSSSAKTPIGTHISVFDAARDGYLARLADASDTEANSKDPEGLTPLHHAVDAEQVTAAKYLLHANADPNSLDKTGSTPLHYAALLGSSSLCAVLIQAGAKSTILDQDGKSPEALAKSEGYKELAAMLSSGEVVPAPTTVAEAGPSVIVSDSVGGISPLGPQLGGGGGSVGGISEEDFASMLAGGGGGGGGMASLLGMLGATELIISDVPTIDVAAFMKGDDGARKAIATKFDKAFKEAGVCHLSNYQELMPESSVNSVREHGKAFFSEPAEVKSKSHVDGVVGYLGVGQENVGASAGLPTALPDPVESLNLPAYQEEGSKWSTEGWRTWSDKDAPIYKGCPWADASWMPTTPKGFRDALVEYWVGGNKLMMLLMELTEMALDLPKGFFTKGSFVHPGTLLRVAWYPPSSKEEKTAAADGDASSRLRYGSHTDYDGFTILQRAEGDAGLEMETKDGRWLPVHSPKETLTVNIGDLLARWTNDRWRATKHRVAKGSGSSEGEGRLSIVYFTGPHPETLVECLPSDKCKGEAGAAKYKPITAEEHVRMKMEAATIAHVN